MTPEERELILKDISARLLYGVFVSIPELNKDEVYKVCSVSLNGITVSNSNNAIFDIHNSIDVYPYLRPVSSITEEEAKILAVLWNTDFYNNHRNDWYYCYPKTTDFYNKHHLDYYRLIEKGLAIAVTEENNPYKL